MSFPLDHVVVAVADLEAAIADWRALGFNVLDGGVHPGRGSRNGLVVFADGAYFEIIAFDRPVPDFRWWRVLDASGDGLVDFALLPNDIEEDVAAARARGLDYDLPVPGGRARPDGERLEWKTARSPKSDVPFFCGDVTARALRVPEGEARVHPNGARGIAAITVAVGNLEASIARWAAYYGTAPVAARLLPEHGLRVAELTAGSTRITLATPEGEGSLGTAVAAHLESRGEGPFSVEVLAPEDRPLDPVLTHGAPITLVARPSETRLA
jgi:catechol 2,3-dioxygenase-like lactoylglutathione lyase family enzyme